MDGSVRDLRDRSLGVRHRRRRGAPDLTHVRPRGLLGVSMSERPRWAADSATRLGGRGHRRATFRPDPGPSTSLEPSTALGS